MIGANEIVMEGVREYCEELPVTLGVKDERLVVCSQSEGGYYFTAVDLSDLLKWIDTHKEQIEKLKAEAGAA